MSAAEAATVCIFSRAMQGVVLIGGHMPLYSDAGTMLTAAGHSQPHAIQQKHQYLRHKHCREHTHTHEYGGCHPGSHYWDYYPHALSLGQVTATHLKIGYLQVQPTGTWSSNESQWLVKDDRVPG